jgi:Fe-S-cluster containining protein
MNRHERRAREAANRKAPSSEGQARANAVVRSLIASNQTFDHDFKQVMDERGVTPEVSCQRGCAACCDQAVLTSLAEGMLIVDQYRPVVQEVVAELLRQEELLVDQGIDAAMMDIFNPATAPARQAFLDQWYAKRVPCAFLDPRTRLCRVYNARPLGCRSHVVMSPPELCDLRIGETETPPTVMGYDPGDEYNVALAHNWSTTRKITGGPTALGFIPTMVLYAFEGAGNKP